MIRMARKHTCTDCHQPIPTGLAVLRGNGHELLAWHRACYALARGVTLAA
jgi:hypothetical protein